MSNQNLKVNFFETMPPDCTTGIFGVNKLVVSDYNYNYLYWTCFSKTFCEKWHLINGLEKRKIVVLNILLIWGPLRINI